METSIEILLRLADSEAVTSQANPEGAVHRLSIPDAQAHVRGSPYYILSRLDLASSYEVEGFPDLAAGEAYRALLLVDEALEDEGEFHEEVVEAFSDHNFSFENIEFCSRKAYSIIARCLYLCGCLRSAFDHCVRGLKRYPEESSLRSTAHQLATYLRSRYKRNGLEFNVYKFEPSDFPERGQVRREIYPWSPHEPDRSSDACLNFLNERLSPIAPKLEIRVTELPVLTKDGAHTGQMMKQLGLFAKVELSLGEAVLTERSLLTADTRMQNEYCDACGAELPSLTSAAEENPTVTCDGCYTVFCSQECYDLAGTYYHSALCGADFDNPSQGAEYVDSEDALHSLLLLRAFAMSIAQDVHPLELPEVKYIWGDFSPLTITEDDAIKDAFHGHPRTLPFTFHNNVVLPIQFLERMDINIFTTTHFDTWVINTLYAKTRGTASARQGPTGRPEVAAVHPMWCLGNHSCDPNVSWEWAGSITFKVMEERAQWKKATGEEKSSRNAAGIKKDEEVLNHYCDISLPVKERRAWAAGALGGDCMCNRCVWEASEK